MSLVAYDSSDDSEEEKTNKNISIVQKKTKEAVKIRIPSLKEFEEDEEIPVAKKPKLQPGSGLFSLLPPPKNTPSFCKPGFVPHILSSKKEQVPSNSKGNQNCLKTKVISAPSVASESQESDEEISSTKDKSLGENSTHNDFFWLDDLSSKERGKQADEKTNFFQNLSSTSNNKTQKINQDESNEIAYFQQHQPSELSTFQKEKETGQNQSSVEQNYSFENYLTEAASESDTPKSLLNDKEFLKLQGHKREFENVDIIDVSADDQLSNKNEWLLKNLTDESAYRPSRKKHNMPTQQQKRKHQITYLAFQAKERENDLKNQWASNSRTRRETQAKYGF